jgi:hypothetical protein
VVEHWLMHYVSSCFGYLVIGYAYIVRVINITQQAANTQCCVAAFIVVEH